MYNRDWDYYEEPESDFINIERNEYYELTDKQEELERIYKFSFERIKEELESYLNKESTADEFAKSVKYYIDNLEEEI